MTNTGADLHPKGYCLARVWGLDDRLTRPPRLFDVYCDVPHHRLRSAAALQTPLTGYSARNIPEHRLGSGFPALLSAAWKAFPDLSLISLEQSKNDEARNPPAGLRNMRATVLTLTLRPEERGRWRSERAPSGPALWGHDERAGAAARLPRPGRPQSMSTAKRRPRKRTTPASKVMSGS